MQMPNVEKALRQKEDVVPKCSKRSLVMFPLSAY